MRVRVSVRVGVRVNVGARVSVVWESSSVGVLAVVVAWVWPVGVGLAVMADVPQKRRRSSYGEQTCLGRFSGRVVKLEPYDKGCPGARL